MRAPRSLPCWVFATLTVVGTGIRGGEPDEPPPKAVEAARKVSPDLESYIQAGFPSPDRDWSGTDFTRCAEALRKIKTDGSLPIPRMGRGPAAALFARMVSDQNLKNVESPTLPLETRIPAAAGILQGVGPVLLEYIDQKSPSQKYGREALEIEFYCFKTFGVVLSLLDKQVAGLSQDERKAPARVEGMKKVRSGLAMSINGAFVTLNETSQYRPEDLATLARRLPEVFPPLWHWLEPSVRSEYAVEIARIEKAHADPEVRKAMTALRKAVSALPKTDD